ncbi:MAG: thioredoxin domain-containing protein [Paracoccus aminovorans]|nr:thioredoxin domain-containing protein [Paracoccus aminovorans]
MPPELRQALEHEQLGAVLGNPSGDVTLTEFFDYNCPYCRASVADIHQLISEDPRSAGAAEGMAGIRCGFALLRPHVAGLVAAGEVLAVPRRPDEHRGRGG